MCEQSISDDEVLFRRIPPGSDWFEPPDHIKSFNFKLRPGEEGISVYRASIVSKEDVLNKPGEVIAGSFLAEAKVGEIRRLTDTAEASLHLDVIAIGDEKDPGHAEIRGEALLTRKKPAAKALKKLFTRVAE